MSNAKSKSRKSKSGRSRKSKGSRGNKSKKQAQASYPAKRANRVFNNSTSVRSTRKPKHQPNGSAVKALCSLTDPFCEHAYGAKIPDGSTTNSLTSSSRGYFTFTTKDSGGAGYAAAFFNPNNMGYCIGSNAAANVGASTSQATPATWTQTSGLSLMTTSASMVRIVSCGIVVRCNLNTANAQGQFNVIEAPAFLVSTAYDTTDLTYPKVTVMPCYSGSTMTVKLSPSNPTLSDQFLSPQTNTGLSKDCGWPSIFVAYTGGSTGTAVVVASVEYFIHFEWVPIATHDVALLASGTPPAQPKMMQARAAVNDKHDNPFEGPPNTVSHAISDTVQAVSKVVDTAEEWWNMAETAWDKWTST